MVNLLPQIAGVLTGNEDWDDWRDWLKRRYGAAVDYAKGYPEAYLSNVKQGMLQSAQMMGTGPGWGYPLAASLNPANILIGDTLNKGADLLSEATGVEQSKIRTALSVGQLASPWLGRGRMPSFRTTRKGNVVAQKAPSLLTHQGKYPISQWTGMPEWTSFEGVTQRTEAPNPVATFYYSRAVEQARTLQTDESYPLQGIADWLPKSPVVDRGTDEAGKPLSKYAKKAIRDELVYFGVDEWAQNQIDLGRDFFKPQELLDYLETQGDIPFRLRTSFAAAPDTGGYDISHEIEWSREYGSGLEAVAEGDPYVDYHVDYRGWGVDAADPNRAQRATEFPFMNEGFVRGKPFTGDREDIVRVRLFQEPPETFADIEIELLQDDNITEPWREAWLNSVGETKIAEGFGTSGEQPHPKKFFRRSHPKSTGIDYVVGGTSGARTYTVGEYVNQSGGHDEIISGKPMYTVTMAAPPMSTTDTTPQGHVAEDWYWQHDATPPHNVAVNFDLSNLGNKMDIPITEGGHVMDRPPFGRVYGSLARTSKYSTGQRHMDLLDTSGRSVPSNETILLQAINHYMESSSEGGALGTDIIDWYKDRDEDPFAVHAEVLDKSLYSASSLVNIRLGMGWENWNESVLSTAVSEGRVRLVATDKPSISVTHQQLGMIEKEHSVYTDQPNWDIEFMVPRTPITEETGTSDTWVKLKTTRAGFTDAVKQLTDLYQYGTRTYLSRSPAVSRTALDALKTINKVITPASYENKARGDLLDIFAQVRQDLTGPRLPEGRVIEMRNTGGYNPTEWDSYYNFSPLTPYVEQQYRFVATSAMKKAMEYANEFGWKGKPLAEWSEQPELDNLSEDPGWMRVARDLFRDPEDEWDAGAPDSILNREAVSNFERFWSRASDWHVSWGNELSGFDEGAPRADSQMRTYRDLSEATEFARTKLRDDLEEYFPQEVVNLGGGEFDPQWSQYTTRHGRWIADIQGGTEKPREVLITVGSGEEERMQHDALYYNWDAATDEFDDEGADVRSAYFGTRRLPPMLGEHPIDSADAKMWEQAGHPLPEKFVPRRYVEGVEFGGKQYPPIYKQMGHWATAGHDLPGEHNLIASMLTTEAEYNPIERPDWKPTGAIKELFIGEMQGDVHQFGSAYGYGRVGQDIEDPSSPEPTLDRLQRRDPFAVEAMRRTAHDLGELAYHDTLLRSGDIGRPYRLAPGGYERQRNQPLLPRMEPSSWAGNALVEAVRFALENNYDYVAWPVGEEIVNKWSGTEDVGSGKKKIYDAYMPKTARQVLGVPVEVGPHANRANKMMMRIPIGDPEVKKILMEFFKKQGIPTFSQVEQQRQAAYA